MPEILEELGGSSSQSERVVTGRITRIEGDRVHAVIPAFNLTHEFGPIRFEHASIAAIGDPILIGIDEQGGAWVISWDGLVNIPGTLPPSGPATGDLSGSYPNPTVAKIRGADSRTVVTALRAGFALTGGGDTSWDAALGLYWSDRFIAIALGRGAWWSTSGYYDIVRPIDGTIVSGHGGVASQTVAGSRVPIPTWSALWYEPTIGGTFSSVDGSFHLTTYTGDFDVPSHWILIAIRNSDVSGGALRLATGHLLRNGQSASSYDLVPWDTALRGNPTTTTQSVGDNGTRIATTAFVYANPNNRTTVADTRFTEETPNVSADYRRVARSEFKQRSNITGTPGTGSFGVLTTYSGYPDDSGGGVKQVWLDDSNPPRMFVRRGTIAGGWSSWQEVAPLASPAFTGTPTAPTPAARDNSTKLATTAYVDGAGGSSPLGALHPYAGSADPAGGNWLIADGRSLTTAGHAEVFAVIGYTYGGSGANFNLPNYKGRMPVGRDAAQTEFATLAGTGGFKTITLSASQSGMPAHGHGVSDPSHSHGPTGANYFATSSALFGTTPGSGLGSVEAYGSTTTGSFTGVSVNNAAAQNAAVAHDNLPPYIVTNYIIRVK